MSSPVNLKAIISLPGDFKFDEVRPGPKLTGLVTPPPSLGPLAAFVGTWAGTGFNTIFRPDNAKTPTPLPIPAGGDNILELNLTQESLAFSPSLGSVPNRGTDPQGDIFLNGVPYLQTVFDVTTGQKIGIHVEPGLWMIVPPTADPAEATTVVRMGSIPHGTTIEAQGTFTTFNGAPTIPPVDITPFVTGSNPPSKIRFASQTASASGTPRIPQDLSSFITAGTITQAILDDPNSVLRNHIATQQISKTTTISISTTPTPPLIGGGTDNIAFLQPNAAAIVMNATFWIEEVEHRIIVPPFKLGQAPLHLKPEAAVPGAPVPTIAVRPPVEITAPRPIIFTTPQIQYSQTVMLNFNGLTWPHVSVATLVPSEPITVPPSVWS